MAASMLDLKGWYERGVELGATHMIVKMDWFDMEDYPIYVMPGQSPRAVDMKNQDRTMECYSMNISWEIQSHEFRAHHWDD